MSVLCSIQHPVKAESREKASRFFSFAYPASTAEEAEACIAQVKKSFHDARHVCFAWRLGPKGDHMRAYDAGEPAHSAGTPILNEIRSRNLSNVVVIVVRYFGGTKLGIPGLIEAYREAASLALAEAITTEIKVLRFFRIRYPYTLTSEVNRILHQCPPESREEEFTEDCRMRIGYTEALAPAAMDKFRELGILVEISA